MTQIPLLPRLSARAAGPFRLAFLSMLMLTAGGGHALLAADNSGAAEVTFKNYASQAVTEIDVVVGTARYWGQNLLHGTLPQNGSFTFKVPSGEGCAWNYRVIYANKAQVYRVNVNLCRLTAVALAGVGAPSKATSDVTLINAGSVTITTLETALATAHPSWSKTELSHGPILPGTQRIIQFVSGQSCQYDIAAIYADGSKEIRANENVCALQSMALAAVATGNGGSVASGTPGPPQATTPTTTPPTTIEVKFLNKYRVPVHSIVAAPANVTSGGIDVLKGKPEIVTDDDLQVQLPAKYGCKWQFHYYYDNDVTTVSSAIDICTQHVVALLGPESGQVLSKGSGFFISPDGYLMTNNHVVYGCGSVGIYRRSDAPIPLKVIAQDSADDLAILKLPGVRTPFVDFRDLDRPIQVGTPVVLLGFPQSFKLVTPILTSGMVGGVEGIGGDPTEFVMQTPTNKGNSGGPVFDLAGRVVGIAVATMADAQNLNFGIKEEVAIRFAQSVGLTLSVTNDQAAPMSPKAIFDRNSSKVVSLICRN